MYLGMCSAKHDRTASRTVHTRGTLEVGLSTHMAEVLLAYRRVCLGDDAHPYAARAKGDAHEPAGLLDSAVRAARRQTARETTQPNRTPGTGVGRSTFAKCLGVVPPSDQPAARRLCYAALISTASR
jgi:hypothetical protein